MVVANRLRQISVLAVAAHAANPLGHARMRQQHKTKRSASPGRARIGSVSASALLSGPRMDERIETPSRRWWCFLFLPTRAAFIDLASETGAGRGWLTLVVGYNPSPECRCAQ